jgi:hypothetical protein
MTYYSNVAAGGATAAELAGGLSLLEPTALARVFAARGIDAGASSRYESTVRVDLIATQLSMPASVSAALLALSLRELTVLRVLWRSGRSIRTRSIAPAFEAVLDPTSLDRCLERLQDLALLLPTDRERSGVFVPSCVRVSLLGRSGPSRPAAELFRSLPGEVLKAICAALGLPPARRHQDRVLALIEASDDADAVRKRIESLPPLARRVFDHVVAKGGATEPWLLGQAFPEARQRAVQDYWNPGFFLTGREQPGAKPDALTLLQLQGLLVRYPPDWSSQLVAPDEVLTALLPPLQVRPEDFDEPPLVAPPAELRPVGAQAAPVLDLVECLQLIDDEQPSLTQKGLFPKPLAKRLARSLSVATPAYADFIFALALQSGLLKREGLTLSVKPRKSLQWLEEGDFLQRAALFAAWRSLGGWRDDREEPYQRTDTLVSGAPYREALLELLAGLPDDGATLDSIAARLRFRIPGRFASAQQPALGEHLPGPEGYVRGALRMLDWLGLAEPLQTPARPGAEATIAALRLTPAGRALLRPQATDDEPEGIPRTDRLIVQPTLDILAPPNIDPELYRVLRGFTELRAAGGMRTTTLTEAALRRALDRGTRPATIRSILEGHGGGALPATVATLLEDVSAKYGRIHVGSGGYYLTVDDPHLLAELQADRRLGGLVQRRLSPTVAIIAGEGLQQILDRLRGAGHMPVSDNGPPRLSPGASEEEVEQAEAAPVPLPSRAPAERSPAPAGNGRILTFPGQVPADIAPGTAVAVSPDVVYDRVGIELLLQAAERDQFPVEIEYISRSRGTNQRTVRVIDVGEVAGNSVFAYCHLRDEDREFNLSRIKSARPATEPPE